MCGQVGSVSTGGSINMQKTMLKIILGRLESRMRKD